MPSLMTSREPAIWYWATLSRNNPLMDLSESQIEEIEAALEKLDQLDPAQLPAPAAELARLLADILEDLETS